MSPTHDARRDAFEDFVSTRGPSLARTAYLLTGDGHLAEDLVQQALLSAARAWPRIEGDPEPYVRRIIYHQNITWWRKRRHLTEASLGSHDSPTPAGDADLRLSLEAALGHLTARQRTVLVLRYFEDLTEAQTATVLGISAGTVKSTGRAALARLRALAPHLEELIHD
ncbi:MAG: SigE family RNA polymerase sigma factor [Nocardioides sp.]|nr:SigE family RNA polymerase sigma factor [Nocardioides sp.]